MDKEILEFASVRNYFEDSLKYGFDYFKNILELSINSKQEIRVEWQNIIDQHLNKKISAKNAIVKIDKWFLDLVSKNKIENWLTVSTLLGKHTITDLFFKIHDKVDDKDYWILMGYCYTNGYLGFEEGFVLNKFFKANRSGREFMMNEDDRTFFNSLPDELTIYRGCSLTEIQSGKYRFSWTLNKNVANFFANEYFRNEGIETDIIEIVVKKEMLLAYFNDREEEEVIYIG